MGFMAPMIKLSRLADLESSLPLPPLHSHILSFSGRFPFGTIKYTYKDGASVRRLVLLPVGRNSLVIQICITDRSLGPRREKLGLGSCGFNRNPLDLGITLHKVSGGRSVTATQLRSRNLDKDIDIVWLRGRVSDVDVVSQGY